MRLTVTVARVPLPCIPPPYTAEPLVIVNPARMVVVSSFPEKVTTEPLPVPIRIVVVTTDGSKGFEERSTMFFPTKVMFPTYVPGFTIISSPSPAELMATWIDSPGFTYDTAAEDVKQGRLRSDSTKIVTILKEEYVFLKIIIDSFLFM
jgi:hypothetical protein